MSRRIAAGASLVAIAICFGSSTFASTPASASGKVTRIFESHPNPAIQRKISAFAINADLGRAWVEVTFDAPTTEDVHEVVRVRVPGLSYNAPLRTIVFQQNGSSFECARVETRGRGVFQREKIVPTGQCMLTHSYAHVPVDNGFEIENVRHFQVHLTTQPDERR